MRTNFALCMLFIQAFLFFAPPGISMWGTAEGDTEDWGSIDENDLPSDNSDDGLRWGEEQPPLQELVTTKWFLADEKALDMWNDYYTEHGVSCDCSEASGNREIKLTLWSKKMKSMPQLSEEGPSIVHALNEDILKLIALKLQKIQSIMRLSQTCKKLQYLSQDAEVWRHLFIVRFGDIKRPENETYQQTYQRAERNNLKIICLNYPESKIHASADSNSQDYSCVTWDYTTNTLHEANLKGTCFCFATFTTTSPYGGYGLTNPDFSGSCMKHVRFLGNSHVVSPIFCKADLANALLEGNIWSPNFRGANLNNATAHSTALRNAAFDEETTFENFTLVVISQEGTFTICPATRDHLKQYCDCFFDQSKQ